MSTAPEIDTTDPTPGDDNGHRRRWWLLAAIAAVAVVGVGAVTLSGNDSGDGDSDSAGASDGGHAPDMVPAILPDGWTPQVTDDGEIAYALPQFWSPGCAGSCSHFSVEPADPDLSMDGIRAEHDTYQEYLETDETAPEVGYVPPPELSSELLARTTSAARGYADSEDAQLLTMFLSGSTYAPTVTAYLRLDEAVDDLTDDELAEAILAVLGHDRAGSCPVNEFYPGVDVDEVDLGPVTWPAATSRALYCGGSIDDTSVNLSGWVLPHDDGAVLLVSEQVIPDEHESVPEENPIEGVVTFAARPAD